MCDTGSRIAAPPVLHHSTTEMEHFRCIFVPNTLFGAGSGPVTRSIHLHHGRTFISVACLRAQWAFEQHASNHSSEPIHLLVSSSDRCFSRARPHIESLTIGALRVHQFCLYVGIEFAHFTLSVCRCTGQKDSRHGRTDSPRANRRLQRSPCFDDRAQRHPKMLGCRQRITKCFL